MVGKVEENDWKTTSIHFFSWLNVNKYVGFRKDQRCKTPPILVGPKQRGRGGGIKAGLFQLPRGLTWQLGSRVELKLLGSTNWAGWFICWMTHLYCHLSYILSVGWFNSTWVVSRIVSTCFNATGRVFDLSMQLFLGSRDDPHLHYRSEHRLTEDVQRESLI